MAFPAVQTADTKNGTVTSNSNSWTLTYPTSLVSGDLILAFVATDGAVTGTWPADWVELIETNASACSGFVAGKISTGAETGNFTLSLSGSEQGSWRIFRVTGWYGSGLAADGQGTQAATGGSSPSLTPDPPSLNPVNWDVEDTLWFAVIAVDTSRTVSAYPTNCPNLQTADVSGGAGGATLGLASASSAVAAFNPDVFTISNSDDCVNITVAIRPAAAAEAGAEFPLTPRFRS